MTSVEQQAAEVIADHILPVAEGKAESEGLSGDRLVAVAQSRAVRNARGAVRTLADAGLLRNNNYRTAYGVWFRSPDGTEEYDWIRDESRESATIMVRNLRKAGRKAEVVARHVSEPRFITKTKEEA